MKKIMILLKLNQKLEGTNAIKQAKRVTFRHREDANIGAIIMDTILYLDIRNNMGLYLELIANADFQIISDITEEKQISIDIYNMDDELVYDILYKYLRVYK